MPDAHRLDDLRRRVREDPASLVFAHLAEECRRAGALDEAIRVCRAGLGHHPEYLSARVTLGRALLARGALDEAQAELASVLGAAPENLAALRGLADIHRQRGDHAMALELYRDALALAPGDPDLLQVVDQLAHDEPAVAGDGAVEPRPPDAAIVRLEAWLDAIRTDRHRRTATGTGPG